MTKCYLAVDATDSATVVAVGTEMVADLADITVRGYPTATVEDAVGRFLTDEAIPTDEVLVVMAVIDHGSDFETNKTLERRIVGALGHGPVVLISRLEARLRGHLEAAPDAPAAALAVLTVGDSHRGQRPTLDLRGARALCAADPAAFELWALHRLGGITDDPVGSQGDDGVVWYPGTDNSGPVRLLVVVQGDAPQRSGTIRALADAAEARHTSGGLLLCLSAPPPEVYDAARHANSTAGRDAAGNVPLVQILTIPEVLTGERPITTER